MADQPEKSPTEKEKGEITPDLVRQIAERVYELWQRELAVERERRRPFSH